MRVEWQCKLCEKKFNSKKDIEKHLKIDHSVKNLLYDEYIQPAITLKDTPVEFICDDSLYIWPLDEGIEMKLEDKGFLTDFAVNVVRNNGKHHLILAFIPKREFNLQEFKEFLDNTHKIVEDLIGNAINKTNIEIGCIEGEFGNISVSKPVGAIFYIIPLE